MYKIISIIAGIALAMTIILTSCCNDSILDIPETYDISLTVFTVIRHDEETNALLLYDNETKVLYAKTKYSLTMLADGDGKPKLYKGE